MSTSPKTSLTSPYDTDVSATANVDKTPLSGTDLTLAGEQLNNYLTKGTTGFTRRETALCDPPVTNQTIGLFSFMPSRGSKPDEHGIYGFAKMRGNYHTEDEADTKATYLIEQVDSTHMIYHAYVGKPFPVTCGESFAESTNNIDLKQKALESVADAIRGKQNDEEKRQFEIKSRTEELLKSSATPDTFEFDSTDSDARLETYTKLRVKKAQVTFAFMEHLKKLDESKQIIEKTRLDIEKYDKIDSTLYDAYYQRYADARDKVGLKITKDSLKEGFLKYMVEDIKVPGVDFVRAELDTLISNYTIIDTGFMLESTDHDEPVDAKSDEPVDAKSDEKKKKAYEDDDEVPAVKWM